MLRRWRKGGAQPQSSILIFEADDLVRRAERYKVGYYADPPYPHVVIDDFLSESAAEKILSAFPAPDAPCWLDWRKRDIVNQPLKQGVGSAEMLEGVDPVIHNALFAFNSYPIIRFLETLTGIEGLIGDPYYFGGGIHQILPGGRLAIHADFNYLDKLKLFRRLNLLLFLNKGWREEYGGHLEMWNADMTRCIKRILPVFNRCVIFNTGSQSYHGHPEPLACPNGTTRKSLAFYYYTHDNPEEGGQLHSTLWQKRPGEL